MIWQSQLSTWGAGYRTGPSSWLSASRVAGKSSARAASSKDALHVSWTDVILPLMGIWKWTPMRCDAVIKDGQLPQGTNLLRISQIAFLKGLPRKQAQVTLAPLQGRDFKPGFGRYWPIEKLCPQDSDRWLWWPWPEGRCSAEDLEEAYALADSADCVLEEFVNFDLEISVIVSGNVTR